MRNTETKFTPRIAPAPWTWEKDKPLLAADGQLVNGVSRTNEQLANHRAMLAAAPALVAALEKLTEAGTEGLWGAWADNTKNGAILKEARAALALAGGGK